MKRINYKSDFDFILKLTTANGVDVGFPEYDWTARFTTDGSMTAFVASYKDGVCTNCYNDDGRLHIVMNNHRLLPGLLRVEFRAEIPDGAFPDESRLVVVPVPLDIELVKCACECPHWIEVEVMLPYIKGDKGDKGDKGAAMSWSEMTEEEREDVIGNVSNIITEREEVMNTSDVEEMLTEIFDN